MPPIDSKSYIRNVAQTLYQEAANATRDGHTNAVDKWSALNRHCSAHKLNTSDFMEATALQELLRQKDLPALLEATVGLTKGVAGVSVLRPSGPGRARRSVTSETIPLTVGAIDTVYSNDRYAFNGSGAIHTGEYSAAGTFSTGQDCTLFHGVMTIRASHPHSTESAFSGSAMLVGNQTVRLQDGELRMPDVVLKGQFEEHAYSHTLKEGTKAFANGTKVEGHFHQGGLYSQYTLQMVGAGKIHWPDGFVSAGEIFLQSTASNAHNQVLKPLRYLVMGDDTCTLFALKGIAPDETTRKIQYLSDQPPTSIEQATTELAQLSIAAPVRTPPPVPNLMDL